MTLFGIVFCAVASTLQVPSASMGRAIPVAVVLPRDYETSGCRYPVDVFGAVGSIYGGVDIMPFSDKFGISNVLGAKEGNEELWRAHSCLTAAAALKPGDLEIITCVGTEDFFLDANRRLHKILNERGIRHSYLEIAGVDKSHSSHHEDFKRMVEPFVFGHIARYFNHRWRDGLRAGAVEDNIK